MSRTAELVSMLRRTEKEFRRIRRTRGLTQKDKQELQKFYIERVFAPETARILRSSAAGTPALPRMLTAKDLEARLQIDRKTIYSYAQRNIIPHVWIQGNVRFEEKEIRRWLELCSFRPTKHTRAKVGDIQSPAAPWKLIGKPGEVPQPTQETLVGVGSLKSFRLAHESS